MLKIAVLVSGGGTNLAAIIEAIESGKMENVQISIVISNNQNAYALERAKQHGIPAVCVSPRDYADREGFHAALLQTLDSCQVDLVVLAGFLVVLPKALIQKYENRIINIHPSLIPSFCGKGFYGLKVHEAALARGVRVTGATVHFVDAGTDTGPILLQKAVSVRPGDTPETLQRRVMEEAEWVLLPEAIRLIAEGRVSVVDGRVTVDEAGEDGDGRSCDKGRVSDNLGNGEDDYRRQQGQGGCA